jgi:hypothetical protein
LQSSAYYISLASSLSDPLLMWCARFQSNTAPLPIFRYNTWLNEVPPKNSSHMIKTTTDLVAGPRPALHRSIAFLKLKTSPLHK